MGKRLLIDDIDYKKINEIYFQLDKKPVRFNYVKLRNCKPSPVPSIIYSEQKLIKIINDWKENFSKYCKPNNKIVILDPNEFTFEVKSFDTTILINYIYHLYNPKDKYLKWNVPINLLDDFKKYIGAIVFKLFSSDDLMFVEGHLNSLSTAICYCPERHKNEMIYLYELLINEDKNFIEKSRQKNLNLKNNSNKHIKNILMYIEDDIKMLIGISKTKIMMYMFNNPENNQNVHSYNCWKYTLKDHIGLDVFGDKPEILGYDKFNGRIELGLNAFFKEFTPEWLITDLKNQINSDSNLVCKIAEFLYYSNIQDEIKIKYVECENRDILFTKSVTIQFCAFILISLKIIIVD